MAPPFFSTRHEAGGLARALNSYGFGDEEAETPSLEVWSNGHSSTTSRGAGRAHEQNALAENRFLMSQSEGDKRDISLSAVCISVSHSDASCTPAHLRFTSVKNLNKPKHYPFILRLEGMLHFPVLSLKRLSSGEIPETTILVHDLRGTTFSISPEELS